jgi:pimeloyl-ACP methyl ester carboxylesterase
VYKVYVAFLSRWRWPLVAVLFPLALWAGIWVHRWLLAASVFLRIEKASEPAWLVHYAEQSVTERATPSGRLYTPADPGGAILLAHGMHEDGIDDPRMITFARSLAGAGYTVLTPRMEGLQRYQLIPEDVQRIRDTAGELAALTGRAQVIVFGISFGGGVAIRAACEGAPAVERVVALGAHQDAERVSRFFLGAPALGPSGEPARVEPHPYGRVALWMSLFGQKHKGAFREDERQRALAALETTREALHGASPSHCPRPLTVPLFLVHGSGDRIVPYTETLWNQQQFAPQVSVRTLISPAIVHAEYDPPSLRERVALMAFVVDGLW